MFFLRWNSDKKVFCIRVEWHFQYSLPTPLITQHYIFTVDEKHVQYNGLTLKFSTPSPTCSMSPAHSNPSMNGVLGGESMAPWRTTRSWKFSPLQQISLFNYTFRYESYLKYKCKLFYIFWSATGSCHVCFTGRSTVLRFGSISQRYQVRILLLIF